MAELRFTHEWLSAGTDMPVFRETSALLGIYFDEICLTRHEDIWSKTVRDAVLVSVYPLALWLASSWWRLNFEPVLMPHVCASHDWRMAHELGAANHGYIWPQLVFATDGEVINAWAEPLTGQGQSVRYLQGLAESQIIKPECFQRSIDLLIGAVLSRLSALGCKHNDLAGLWAVVQEDRADPAASRMRRLEAQLGFDPEMCPAELMAQALALQDAMGQGAMAELAPLYGAVAGGTLREIVERDPTEGMRGRPEIEWHASGKMLKGSAPWARGANAAQRLRTQMGNLDRPLQTVVLSGLLGMTEKQAAQCEVPSRRISAAMARPVDGGYFHYMPRKRHPHARRFELSRFLGDYLMGPDASRWLVSTDLATARQKYQRAFAAELLCPIQAVVDFLDGDLSDSMLDEAAEHFGVGEFVIRSLLGNNGYVPSQETRMPFSFAP